MNLTDQRVAITGKLTTMTLNQCFTLLQIIHAIPQNHVTRDTNYLIVGTIRKNMFEEPRTTRFQKAENYHVQQISEKTFLQMTIAALKQLESNLKE